MAGTSTLLVYYFIGLVILALFNNSILVPAAETNQILLQDFQNTTFNNTTQEIEIGLFGIGDILANPLSVVIIIGGLIFITAAATIPKIAGSGADRGGTAVTMFTATTVVLLVALLIGNSWITNIPILGPVLFVVIALSGVALIFATSQQMLAG